MGGSNPSLRVSAILFVVCLICAVLGADFVFVSHLFGNLMEGTMENIEFNAVMVVVCKSLFTGISAVMAGLVANGVTPHLQ